MTILRLLSVIFLFSTSVYGKERTPSSPPADTLLVFGNHFKLLLKSGDSAKMETQQSLLDEYVKNYNIDKLHCSNGFSSKNLTARLYHTNLAVPSERDGGIAIWNLISQFTDRVTEAYWLKSGFEMVGATTVYSVDLISMDRDKERFMRLFFFNDNNTLVFLSFECPLQIRSEQALPQLAQLRMNP